MRKAVEGNHPAVVYELEVMIRWVEEREEEWGRTKKKKGRRKKKSADEENEEKEVQGTKKDQK